MTSAFLQKLFVNFEVVGKVFISASLYVFEWRSGKSLWPQRGALHGDLGRNQWIWLLRSSLPAFWSLDRLFRVRGRTVPGKRHCRKFGSLGKVMENFCHLYRYCSFGISYPWIGGQTEVFMFYTKSSSKLLRLSLGTTLINILQFSKLNLDTSKNSGILFKMPPIETETLLRLLTYIFLKRATLHFIPRKVKSATAFQ